MCNFVPCDRVGPIQSGHMVRNELCWDANNAVELPKQRDSYLQSRPTFLRFESHIVFFFFCASGIINSVPCDRIVQRASCQNPSLVSHGHEFGFCSILNIISGGMIFL